MSSSKIIVDTNSSETRIALLESGKVASFFIERHRERGILSNLYLGTVNRVLPGMQSAFIDIGIGRSAFLYGGDVIDPQLVSDEANLDVDDEGFHIRSNRTPIEKVLKQGQTILCQIAKEPLGSKGARVTMCLTLPGRYLVLMPYFHHVGISRRIEDSAERDRLKKILEDIKPKGVGVIVRTAARGVAATHMKKDLKYLVSLWRDIEERIAEHRAPTLIHRDLDIIKKMTREVYSDEVEQIVINDFDHGRDLKRFLSATIPGASKRVHVHAEKRLIFDHYGVETQLSMALGKKVDLPSGGHLVVEQTEALTSFDVNTGSYVGQGDARQTILKTNLEATVGIVEQLRIRNIGGIIVLDYIDMEHLEDRELVYQKLINELKQDKARSHVLKISELGLVQMTRKRTADSLERILMEACPHCGGKGHVRSLSTEAYDLIREIQRQHWTRGRKRMHISIREDLRDWLLEEEYELFEQTVNKLKIEVVFELKSIQRDELAGPSFEVLDA